MSPPTPVESLAQGLDAAFSVNYPIFEEDEEIISDDDGMEVKNVVIYERSNYEKKREKKKRSRRKSKKDLRLAQRTSDILSNYRNFLQEYDMMEGESTDPPEDGFYNLHYYEHRSNKTLINKQGDTRFSRGDSSGSGSKTVGLLRDFSDVPLGSSDVGTEEGRKYKLAVLRTKRVKFGVCASLGLVAVLAVVGSVIMKSSKNKMPERTNAPGWHNEAAYILEREHGDNEKKLPQYGANVPKNEPKKSKPHEVGVNDVLPTFQIIVENDEQPKPEESVPETEAEFDAKIKQQAAAREPEIEPAKAEQPQIVPATTDVAEPAPVTESSKTTTTTGAVAAAGTFDLTKVLHDKFKPLWLGPDAGWTGGSHDDAVLFCKGIRGKELCPYAAVCPYGPGHNVMAGRRPVDFSKDGEQWAPIYGEYN